MMRCLILLALMLPGIAAAQAPGQCLERGDAVRCVAMAVLDGAPRAHARLVLQPTAGGPVVAAEVTASLGLCSWPGPGLVAPRTIGAESFRHAGQLNVTFAVSGAGMPGPRLMPLCLEFLVHSCRLAAPAQELPVACGSVLSLPVMRPALW